MRRDDTSCLLDMLVAAREAVAFHGRGEPLVPPESRG